jgi:hypothetical protein
MNSYKIQIKTPPESIRHYLTISWLDAQSRDNWIMIKALKAA